MIKLFILCDAKLNHFRQESLKKIIDDPGISICGVGINNRKSISLWNKVIRELKKGRGGYVLIQILRKLLKKESFVSSNKFFELINVPILKIKRLYDNNTYYFIRAQKPDVIFLCGFGIIKEQYTHSHVDLPSQIKVLQLEC